LSKVAVAWSSGPWLSRNRNALARGRVGDPRLPPGQLTSVAERFLPAEGGHVADHAQVELLLPPAAGVDAAVFERGPEPDRLSAVAENPRPLGVQLVISDAHAGLKNAIAAVLLGTARQRSSVNIVCGGTVPLVHLRRRERTLATRP
jgi:hypothetical protein